MRAFQGTCWPAGRQLPRYNLPRCWFLVPEQGDLSFPDMVRAFRRKKLIESLIRGGDARLKVVEFHEK